jgi:hypothetical protein
MDADFCAQFIKVMHTQGTPGFPTLLCYDKVERLSYPLSSSNAVVLAARRPCEGGHILM